ncbi:MAG: M24 family metallopeptidase [Chloroflexi bacterium]|nr:M24 family metallopeptidase [Chloroflexota bacterium]
MNEFDEKQARVSSLLAEHNLDVLLLQRVSSFAWATCGAASYVNAASTDGASSLLIGPNGHYLITNNIEAPRLEQEERLDAQGWQFRAGPWHESEATIAELTRGLKLGADGLYPGATDLSREVSHLRAALTPEEGDRFRELGRLCAEAMSAATHAVRPAMTEYEISALVARETQLRGAQPTVNLVATDERVLRFRHPLPTNKRLERYAMLVLCGRKWGLVCSITRLVYFGHLPDDLRRKAEATARVDATLIAGSCPGRTLGAIFAMAKTAYAETGYPNEWRHHHQGGPAGYEPREFLATPDSTEVIALGQAYAWNPSIAGTKSEDTVLIGEHGTEEVTSIRGWPMQSISLGNGQIHARPAILEIS